MWQLISTFFVLIGPFVVLIYDYGARYYGGPKSTITSVIQSLTVDLPELPAIFAALFVWLWMHLFLDGVIERVNRHSPPPTPDALVRR